MYSKILALSLGVKAQHAAPGQAIFWEDTGYQGASFSMQLGQEWDGDNNEWNDRISSFMIGEGVRLTLCQDAHCENPDHGGSSEAFGYHESPVMNEWNDCTSHIKVMPYKGPNVLLFKDDQCIVGYAGIFGPGHHNTGALEFNHIGNDSMTGIRVEEGIRVTLFEDEDFQGHRTTLIGPVTYCDNIPDFGNDTLSSMIVDIEPRVNTRGNWTPAVRSNE